MPSVTFPEGSSVNDRIPKELSSVHYDTIDDAIKKITSLGAGCFLAKTDIKSAFRIIPLHPRDFDLLGLEWEGKFYFDRCLPMGCSSSCNIFETFSTALEWIASTKLQASAVIHILDDFLFLAPSRDQCHRDLDNFIKLCSDVGVPIADEKTVGPATCLQFAGITLDTINMHARLPEDKLERCRGLLTEFYNKRSVTLKELQSLIGLLNFACSVVLPGRAFLRRMIDLTKGVRKPYHHIRLTRQCKEDILLWLSFLNSFNGKSFFLSAKWLTSSNIKLYTDSAGSLGYAAVLGKRWFFGHWPDSWKSLNITILELFPIVLATEIWGTIMCNHCIVFFSDNHAVVDIINKQTSREPKVMVLVRRLVLNCLKYNILFKSKHIPGILNRECDLLSRLQVDKFKLLAPHADVQPTPVPSSLLPQNWKLT